MYPDYSRLTPPSARPPHAAPQSAATAFHAENKTHRATAPPPYPPAPSPPRPPRSNTPNDRQTNHRSARPTQRHLDRTTARRAASPANPALALRQTPARFARLKNRCARKMHRPHPPNPFAPTPATSPPRYASHTHPNHPQTPMAPHAHPKKSCAHAHHNPCPDDAPRAAFWPHPPASSRSLI